MKTIASRFACLLFSLCLGSLQAADDPASTALRQMLAKEHADYAAEWEKTAASGTPDAYLSAARAPKEEVVHFGNVITEFFYPQMKKADHFRRHDMRPWLTHLDISEREFTIAAGSVFCLSAYELFDQQLPDQGPGGQAGGIVAVIKLDDETDGPRCEIVDVTCKPEWPVQTDAVITKWFSHPPSKKKIGYTCLPVWIHVPEDAPEGTVTLLVTAKGKGPKDGKEAAEIAITEKLTLHITPPAPQTRAQALGLWAEAILLKDQMKAKPASPRQAAWKSERRRIHALLQTAAARGDEHARFVSTLLSHTEYEEPPVEKEGAEAKAQPGNEQAALAKDTPSPIALPNLRKIFGENLKIMQGIDTKSGKMDILVLEESEKFRITAIQRNGVIESVSMEKNFAHGGGPFVVPAPFTQLDPADLLRHFAEGQRWNQVGSVNTILGQETVYLRSDDRLYGSASVNYVGICLPEVFMKRHPDFKPALADQNKTLQPKADVPKPEQQVQTSKWPASKGELRGKREVRVRNPNDFSVKVGLRSAGKGRDFTVGANAVESAFVPDGSYDIYFQYSTDSDSLYQGDSFTLQSNGVEIKIVKVVNGNYGIRKVR